MEREIIVRATAGSGLADAGAAGRGPQWSLAPWPPLPVRPSPRRTARTSRRPRWTVQVGVEVGFTILDVSGDTGADLD